MGERGLELGGDDAGDDGDLVRDHVEDHDLAEVDGAVYKLALLVEGEAAHARAEVERLVGDASEELLGADDRDLGGQLLGLGLDGGRGGMEVELVAKPGTLDDGEEGKLDQIGRSRVIRGELVGPDARLLVPGDG